MPGRYRDERGTAEFYVRAIEGERLLVLAEAATDSVGEKPFCWFYLGSRVPGQGWRGNVVCLPKGRSNLVAPNVLVEQTEAGFRLEVPDLGSFALTRADSDFPVNDGRPWGAGFYDEAVNAPAFFLTGVWAADDGGTYYVRQVGNTVVWLGEGPDLRWCNAFSGTLAAGGLVSGAWYDLPKALASSSGSLTLQLGPHPRVDTLIAAALGPAGQNTFLARTAATGGFGGATWSKTDSQRVSFRAIDLEIVRNRDVGGSNPSGDEPYLLCAHAVLDGNQFSSVASLIQRSTERIALSSPHVVGPFGIGRAKNNITWREDLPPSEVLPIGDDIGYHELELRSLPGLQPNSALARNLANYLPILIAIEEASSREKDLGAAWRKLMTDAPNIVDRELRRASTGFATGAPLDIPAVVERVTERLVELVKSAAFDSGVSELPGIVSGADPDKVMGVWAARRSFGELRDASLRGRAITAIHDYRQGGGHWKLRATIDAQRSPVGRIGPIQEVLIELRTGDDDKRRDSVVEVAIIRVGGAVLGPYPIHLPGESFPDRTTHKRRIVFDQPVRFGDPRVLRLHWQQGRQGADPARWDKWSLASIRLVAFDTRGRRFVLAASSERRTLGADSQFDLPLAFA